MSGWNGRPWDNPSMLEAQERFYDQCDYLDELEIERQEAIRERDANMPAETRELMQVLEHWWQDELDGKHD